MSRKLSPDASSLNYSTFLGAGGGTGIVLDSNLNAIITGGADNPTFPVTSNAYLPTMKDCCAFLSKVSPDGSQLLYSTFLGSSSGAGSLSAMGIGLDPGGNIWLSGSTTDFQLPMLNPLQSVPPASGHTGFVSEFDSTGTTLKFSTFFGGSSPGVDGIALDSMGKAHIAGTTVTGTYTTPSAFLGTVTAPPQFVQYTYGYAAEIDPVNDSPAVCFGYPSPFGVNFSYTSLQKTVKRTLTISNCGNSALSIQSIQVSNPAFNVPSDSNNCSSTIAPNASCTFAISFTPTSAANYSATLTITSNASIPTTSLPVSGIGAVPVATITTNAISFSPLLVGQTTGLSPVFIRNTGNDILTVT